VARRFGSFGIVDLVYIDFMQTCFKKQGQRDNIKIMPIPMRELFTDCLWKNFAAAIDMLKSVIVLCPVELWKNDKKFYYLTYHTVLFLDYYLTNPVSNFHPILPYTITDPAELPPDAVDDVIPDQFYNKDEFLIYLSTIREKCKKLITETPAEKLQSRWIEEAEIETHGLCPTLVINYSVLEILFYNLRHVQHHTAQLNLILRQKANVAAQWISHAN